MIHWNAEITTNSAASAIWYHGSTQLSAAADVHSCETSVAWPSRLKEINNNRSRVRAEGTWSSSPHVNISLDLFSNSLEDDKTVTLQSTLSDFVSPVSSRLSNCLANDHVEKEIKSETSLGCRLFGIDLTKNSETIALATLGSGGGKGHSSTAASKANTLHEPDAKSSKEQKQHIPDESLSKQGSTLSTRTRTKVNFLVIAG